VDSGHQPGDDLRGRGVLFEGRQSTSALIYAEMDKDLAYWGYAWACFPRRWFCRRLHPIQPARSAN
jgi:hypothetical protein